MANISDKGYIKVEKAECFVVNPQGSWGTHYTAIRGGKKFCLTYYPD